MRILQIGLMKYSEALALMEDIHSDIASDQNEEEAVLIVEHLPVVTMGLRDRSQDLKFTEEHLSQQGIDFVRIDRGGSVTVHEPGQLVLYPLLRIDARYLTVRRLVWALEEIMILECARWGIKAARDEVNPGIWFGQNKIGAVGIRIANHVSKHGLALNIFNNLETFSRIIPCGIHGRGVAALGALGLDVNSLEKKLPLIGLRMAADLKSIVENFRKPESNVSSS